MMTLGIDTASPTGGVALAHKEKGLIGEIRLKTKRTHSEQVMRSVDYILDASGFRLDEIDFFTVTVGPGSFTGLRVGLSTVKGLSFATGKSVAAVSTLEAFAFSFPATSNLICPLLDARKKEVYGGIFRWSGEELSRIMHESVLDIGDIFGFITEDTIFAGNGAVMYRNVIIESVGARALFAPPHVMSPLPSALCILGFQKAEKGEFSDPVSLAPLYLRKSEAEIQAERK
jgi:tRNA threonylcarbamoyladenosine biosynthesis protein TsaB